MQSVGSIWTVQALAWPAACQSLCDEGCRFQTHLKLRNECEILKNEIYSVKSELKVFTFYFLTQKFWVNWELHWFSFFRTERLRKFVFEFWTLFKKNFLTFFQQFLRSFLWIACHFFNEHDHFWFLTKVLLGMI